MSVDQAGLARLSPHWISWTARQLAVSSQTQVSLSLGTGAITPAEGRENFSSPFNKKWLL